ESEQTEGFPPLFEQIEHSDRLTAATEHPEVGSEEWDREQKRLHERNVAAVFGDEAAREKEEAKRPESEVAANEQPAPSLAAGTLEEEEIDEEEADLASYVEELEEDATFEELEEETHAASDFAEPAAPPEVDRLEEGASVVPFSAEPLAEGA